MIDRRCGKLLFCPFVHDLVSIWMKRSPVGIGSEGYSIASIRMTTRVYGTVLSKRVDIHCTLYKSLNNRGKGRNRFNCRLTLLMTNKEEGSLKSQQKLKISGNTPKVVTKEDQVGRMEIIGQLIAVSEGVTDDMDGHPRPCFE
jgi:hypothetical protein